MEGLGFIGIIDMNNYERIKVMTIDEMLDLFTFSEPYCGYANRNCDGRCRSCAELWLSQEEDKNER